MATNTFSNQKITAFREVGILDSEHTTTSACDVRDLEDVIVVSSNAADGSATAKVQINQDLSAAKWSDCPASSTSSAGYGKTYALTGRVAQIRGATVVACTTGTFTVYASGWNNNQKRLRALSLLGPASATTFSTTGAGIACDVSELEKVIVTWTSMGTQTIKLQASYNGTDWIDVGSKTADGSLLVPIPCKLIRGNCSSRSSGSAYLRAFGSTAIGKQRFATLGTFTGATTGTAVDVSDLDSFSVYAQYTDSGTFVCAGTIVIEGSLDGTTYAPIASNFTSAGSADITGPYKLVRARCSSYTVGTIDVRLGGVNTGLVG